jgi:hypothetical protein
MVILLLIAGVAVGVGVGVVAARALARPVYRYPTMYPGYGYGCPPAFYLGPRVYYTTAY